MTKGGGRTQERWRKKNGEKKKMKRKNYICDNF